MKATVKIRCTMDKNVWTGPKGPRCTVYVFSVLGGHEGGNPTFPSGMMELTVMNGEFEYQRGEVYEMSLSSPE